MDNMEQEVAKKAREMERYSDALRAAKQLNLTQPAYLGPIGEPQVALDRVNQPVLERLLALENNERDFMRHVEERLNSAFDRIAALEKMVRG